MLVVVTVPTIELKRDFPQCTHHIFDIGTSLTGNSTLVLGTKEASLLSGCMETVFRITMLRHGEPIVPASKHSYKMLKKRQDRTSGARCNKKLEFTNTDKNGFYVHAKTSISGLSE
jgi:hypothetical protein